MIEGSDCVHCQRSALRSAPKGSAGVAVISARKCGRFATLRAFVRHRTDFHRRHGWQRYPARQRKLEATSLAQGSTTPSKAAVLSNSPSTTESTPTNSTNSRGFPGYNPGRGQYIRYIAGLESTERRTLADKWTRHDV